MIIVLLASLSFSGDCISQQLPKNHGSLATKLFLSQDDNHSLIVAFGGSEGGNTFASEQTSDVREGFLKRGFHFLAVSYFGTRGLPKTIDRISLDAIYDTIVKTSEQLDISTNNVILLGSSRGGELVLNLASNFEFKGVIALVPANITVPSLQNKKPTSSWILNQKQIEFINIDEKILKREGWLNAIEKSLAIQEKASAAFIKVENIQGFVLLTSGKADKLWPSYQMCNAMIERMEKNNFNFPYAHIAFEGGHTPATHWSEVFAFLDKHLKNK